MDEERLSGLLDAAYDEQAPGLWDDTPGARGPCWTSCSSRRPQTSSSTMPGCTLDDGAGRFDPRDVQELRRPHTGVPDAAVSDAWGLRTAPW